MLRYVLAVFAVAINAVVFGFGPIATAAGNIPKISFFVFLALFLFSLIEANGSSEGP
jgi:uncharacterized membrane protein YtjA (UPF0391 family)